jgi:hypothetical protein
MISRRRFSRRGHEFKLSRRDELEKVISEAVGRIIKDHDPTAHMPAVRSAARLVGLIGSHIAAQKQVVQRALRSIEGDLDELGEEFVDQLVSIATSTVPRKLKTFKPVPPLTSDSIAMTLTDEWAGPVAGPTMIEKNFGIPRSILYRWQKRNEVVWVQSRNSRKPLFPLRQFKDGKPIDGIPELIDIFGDPGAAWAWCINGADASPLSQLLQGKVQAVIDQAHQVARRT